jgi:hypothetical protein
VNLDEEWVTIYDFPKYEISNLGNVSNRRSGKLVAKSVTHQQVVKVALINERGRFTRSVSVLVANVFVYGRTDIFNTPIHLDGDLKNCEATNLAWRPRWFAYQYHQQLSNRRTRLVDEFSQFGPLYEPSTHMRYDNVLEAAIMNGLLIKDIVYRTNDPLHKRVQPTGQVFEFENQGPDQKIESEY